MVDKNRGIGICGLGMVGNAVFKWFAGGGFNVGVYDPAKGYYDTMALDRPYVFICVPTPNFANGEQNLKHVYEAIDSIPKPTTVVIKSTVLPGTTLKLANIYTGHKFLFNPEFLTEATADRDMEEPARQIVGACPISIGEARELLDVLPKGKYFHGVTDVTTAEMAKYMSNTFYAMKVAYANQIYDLCKAADVDYERVRELAIMDPMMASVATELPYSNHLDVMHGRYRGYGGKCLPKDVKALVQYALHKGVRLGLLEEAECYNELLKLQKDKGNKV